MMTIRTRHLGDGAYVGRDPYLDQVWLGANHHENMTVALGEFELRAFVRWLKENGYRRVLEEGSES